MAKKDNLPRGISTTTRSRNGRDVKLYQVRVTWQGRRELIGRFETLRDARAALDIARGDIARGTFVPPRTVRAELLEGYRAERAARLNAYTVRELADDWLDHVRRMGRKQSTIYTYRKKVDGHVLPHFGAMPVDAVTAQEVQDWFDALDAEHGNGVSRGAYMMLSGMFTYATGKASGQSPSFRPIITESPCRVAGAAKHKPVTSREAEDVVITDDQLSAIVAAMPPADRLAVLLGGWQALRIGEVLGLQRRDVRAGWLTIARQLQSRGAGLQYDTPKTTAGVRNLPILSIIAEAVDQHLEQHVGTATDSPLFPRTKRGAQPIHPNNLRKHLDAAIAAANAKLAAEERPQIPPTFTFHSLRHTALTRLGNSGATTEELKLFAGHSDDKTVQRYQHATRDRLAALADRVSAGA